MRVPSVKQLRGRLEERRRRALGLVKALDRCGLSPDLLNASALHLFALRDGDCLVWLARLTSLPPRSAPPSGWEEIPQIEQEMDRLETAILQSVPLSDRDAVAAHQVGMLIVQDDEIYDDVARRRRS